MQTLEALAPEAKSRREQSFPKMLRSQRSREVALKLPRLSPLRRPKAGDPHYSWYHVDANRDGCGDDGGGADIPVTETNCVFAPSLPPGKQQPVLITTRAHLLASPLVCYLLARSPCRAIQLSYSARLNVANETVSSSGVGFGWGCERVSGIIRFCHS